MLNTKRSRTHKRDRHSAESKLARLLLLLLPFADVGFKSSQLPDKHLNVRTDVMTVARLSDSSRKGQSDLTQYLNRSISQQKSVVYVLE